MTGAGHDDMPAYLRALDLLCVPSLTTARWREQLGRVVLEQGAGWYLLGVTSVLGLAAIIFGTIIRAFASGGGGAA